MVENRIVESTSIEEIEAMASPQIDASGNCQLCKTTALSETDAISCYDCQGKFHGVCGEAPNQYCSNTFLRTFQKLKSGNFVFVCDMCLTRKENNQASSIKEQISSFTDTVNSSINDKISLLTNTVEFLVKEVSELKNQNANNVKNDDNGDEMKSTWSNPQRVAKMKASLCIRSKGAPVNLEKVQEIAKTHSIQVSKTVVKDNGDVFVDLPTEENRDKLSPLLQQEQEETFARNEIVNVKSKLPTISILDVKDYTTKEEFVEKVKGQNPVIKNLIEKGSEFSIVFSKEPKNDGNNRNKYHQVIARVSNDVRQAIKNSNNKIYTDLASHHVVDRFFVKRCNRCQNFGHYEKDCTEDHAHCGYCKGHHLSKECNGVQEGDFEHYECVNCERSGKESNGHSAYWHKCPSYLDLQKKVKNSIPYYSQKN